MSESKISLETIYGQKAGMTRIFTEEGNHIPVTVVKLIPNIISQVKTEKADGYSAYQVAYYEKREKVLTSPVKGHLKKAGIDSFLCRFAEIKSTSVDPKNLGLEVTPEAFSKDTMIDVTGISKGKGFAGVMKRYNFSGGPAAHGSKFHRTTGSIGQHTEPGRVIKNKKMPGHMGVDVKTVQNLEVIELNIDQGYMLIKGSVPGAKNGFVKIAKALKKKQE